MKSPAQRRRGFTLIEAMVSTTIAALAGAALLQGIYSSIGSTKTAQEQTMAAGLAQQMMDEIAGKTFCAVRNSPHETSLGPSGAEQAGAGRSLFNDIDDFNGVRHGPIKDPWSISVGDDDGKGGSRHVNMRTASSLSKFRREVDVYYVSASDLKTKLTGGQTSDFRMVEVRVYVDDPNGARRSLATLKRVFAYVPTL